jgi:hypothetical protein
VLHGYSHMGEMGELFETVERFAEEVLPTAGQIEVAPIT